MKWWHLVGIVALLAIGGRVMLLNSTRGLRNKNPGNIRNNPAFTWNGQVGVDEAGFVIFDTFENGVRAMGRVLDSYKRRGLVTVPQIISAWAPPSENDTESYISAVMDRIEIFPSEPIEDWRRHELVAAIIHHENGVNPFSSSFIDYSLDLA